MAKAQPLGEISKAGGTEEMERLGQRTREQRGEEASICFYELLYVSICFKAFGFYMFL